MKLWKLESKVLKGFYQSDVFAAAETRDDAIQCALMAYDRWLSQEIEIMYFHPLLAGSWSEDPEYPAEAKKIRDLFHRELKDHMTTVPGRAVICRSV